MLNNIKEGKITMPGKVEIVLTKAKEYNRSVRYDAPTEPVIEGAPSNFYLKKQYSATIGNPDRIKLTIEAAE